MNLSVRLPWIKHEKHVIARAIACGMLLVLPSCAIPHWRDAKLGPDLPADFNGAASPENSAQLSIEEFFNDPILTCLICQALANNRELKILEEEVQIANNEVLSRSGAYLPFVTFGASAELDKFSNYTLEGASIRDDPYLPPNKFLPNPLPNYLLGPNVFWQLDIWRQLRNARDAAKQRYLAAIDRRNYFVTRLVAEVAENYYGLMAFDQRLQNLDRIIVLQEQSLKIAQFRLKQARGTSLPVQRFLAEVRKNRSQKLIVNQDIIQTENRINFLVNRFPQPVERQSARFFDLTFPLSVGVPSQLLHNRPDIRQAERELEAAGLDVKVARARFFPVVAITAGVGYEAFSPQYLFVTPEAMVASVAGNLVVPLINKRAIQADYKSANARQLQSIYNYQRVILNAFTEVVNRLSKVENYRRSIEIKRRQLEALEASVDVASKLFQAARVEYIDVLFAQRDLFEARYELIETNLQQLAAVVNTYQALGGGLLGCGNADLKFPEAGMPIYQSQPGGSNPSGTEQLPVPRKLPEQLPAPDKQPGQLPALDKQSKLPAPGKEPEQLAG